MLYMQIHCTQVFDGCVHEAVREAGAAWLRDELAVRALPLLRKVLPCLASLHSTIRTLCV